jgi:signal transduction histidine kinase
MIGDLLDVASLDAGRLVRRADPGDAVAVVSEAVETFRAAASAKA